MTEAGAQRAQRRSQNARSRAQEARLASDLGGRVQIGSGSSWRAKADVRDDEFTVEVKYTDARSFALTSGIMKKVITAAEQQGREPRIVIDFVTLGIRATVDLGDIPDG